jgi:mono/diheme cytochrome c family protein
MIRGSPSQRIALAVLSPVFLGLWMATIWSEDHPAWKGFQEEFAREFARRAAAKTEEARRQGDSEAAARWRRLVEATAHRQPEIRQTYLEGLRVADRCPTCHLGAANPLFADAREPFRTHPGRLLDAHDPDRFGCAVCHGGDPAATTVEGAHGRKESSLGPLLPTRLVQSSCPACHEITHGLEGAEVVTRGADLYLEKGCYGCHGARGAAELPKFGPPLGALRSKLRDPARWIYAWLRDPKGLSPGTAMPEFGFGEEEAAKVTAFLLALPGGMPPGSLDLGGASAAEGKRLFEQKGCRACHGVEPGETGASPRVPNLAGIGSKVTAEWLDRWIADPRAYDPHSPMPKIEMTEPERRAVVAYLLGLERPEPLPAAPDPSRFWPEEGRELVRQYECYGCHEIPGFENARPSVPDLGEFARKRVDDLDFGSRTDLPRTKWDWLDRKLREPRAFETEKIRLRMPRVAMTEEERSAIVAFALGFGGPVLPEPYRVKATRHQEGLRVVAWAAGRFHCNACHRLGGRDPRLAAFVERRSQLPPTLDGIGARLQGQYLFEFLLEPKPVRPWLALRMPTFGFTDAEARRLAEGFSAAGGADGPWTHVVPARLPPERLRRGLRRFAHYKCGQCHPTSVEQGLPPKVDPEDLSINLMLAKERLRPEWIRQFLARPKQIAGPETRMPTVFYTVDGVPKVDRPEEDIEDIVTYLLGMTEPAEASLAALAQEEKAEQENVVDWTKVEY